MTTDQLNINTGNAIPLLMEQQNKAVGNSPTDKFSRLPDEQSTVVASKAATVKNIEQKTIFQVGKSYLPINKPIEENQDTIKAFIEVDNPNSQNYFQEINKIEATGDNPVNQLEELILASPFTVSQKGHFVTLSVKNEKVENAKLLARFAESTIQRIRDRYKPLSKYNRGKLVDLSV